MKHSRLPVTIAFAIVCLSFISGRSLDAAEPNTLSDAQRQAGWKLLFDGESTEQWRNYQKDRVGSGWKVKDGSIVWLREGAGDIITKEQYESYELVLEYQISTGGNSGLMFGVTEAAETPWMTGPEIQIQDNVKGKDPQKAGWLYQLYAAETDATRPAGEWNKLRIRIVKGGTSTIWMNGTKYCEFVQGSDDWNARVAKSKFKDMPAFGKHAKGHICLQDHGNDVAFRSIRIRTL